MFLDKTKSDCKHPSKIFKILETTNNQNSFFCITKSFGHFVYLIRPLHCVLYTHPLSLPYPSYAWSSQILSLHYFKRNNGCSMKTCLYHVENNRIETSSRSFFATFPLLVVSCSVRETGELKNCVLAAHFLLCARLKVACVANIAWGH